MMKTKLITLLIAITAIVGSAEAQEYDRVIELYKGGELIQKYKLPEVDSIKFNKEYKYAVSATISPVNSGTVAINGKEGKQYISVGETATFVATPKSGYQFKNWSISGIVISTAQSYTTTISTDLTLTANFEEQSTPLDPYNGHEYVDLGLPSGIKWATCNVGANSPEGYGDYFAWGETEPKTTHKWSTYKYCNGTEDTMTKYCTSSSYGTVDNKTVLELEDDAARVNWGGNWRMPTEAELSELKNTNNCTWEWTTQNGVNGYKVTSKKNGNSIFLPAAGFRYNGNLSSVGSSFYYWSNSLNTSYSGNANAVEFISSYVYLVSVARYYGLSVRAVCESSTPAPTPIVYTVSVSATEGGTAEASATEVEEGTSVTLTATPAQGYEFVNWTVNGEVVSTENPYNTTITANTEYVANFEEQITPVDPYNGHEYVDLGLSVKWATCNVGATTPEGYGDYFAWGETEPKDNYSWSTYKYCNGSEYTMTKYCVDSTYGTVDNKTTLELSDDAARVNWGSKWRMPTRAEQDELRNTSNCTWTWTTQNGVKGYKVTSKKNGNSIFLPAAGLRGNGNLYYHVGSIGYYWSSSLNTSNSDDAYLVNFYSGIVDWHSYIRYTGQSVRAVCE